MQQENILYTLTLYTAICKWDWFRWGIQVSMDQFDQRAYFRDVQLYDSIRTRRAQFSDLSLGNYNMSTVLQYKDCVNLQICTKTCIKSSVSPATIYRWCSNMQQYLDCIPIKCNEGGATNMEEFLTVDKCSQIYQCGKCNTVLSQMCPCYFLTCV